MNIHLSGSHIDLSDATVSGVHLLSGGNGPPLFLLHGIGSCSLSFVPQFDTLASHLHLYAWDAPGYAKSHDPPHALTMDDYADSVLRVMKDLELTNAHVLGLSWGGVIATRLALRSPTSVRSLILADTTVGSGCDPERARAMDARIREFRSAKPRVFAQKRASRLLKPSADRATIRKVEEIMAYAIRSPGYEYAARAMAETDHTPRLGEIRCPTLILVGAKDSVTPHEESRKLVNGIPRATLKTIDDAGHMSNEESPDQFARYVLDFVTEVEKGASAG